MSGQGSFVIALGLLAGWMGGCAHSVHQVYVSDSRPYQKLEAGDVVKGRSEQFVILGMTGQTNFVEEARADLIRQCPNGDLSSITTQISTSLGFFSWTNKALMQGLCTKPLASIEGDFRRPRLPKRKSASGG